MNSHYVEGILMGTWNISVNEIAKDLCPSGPCLPWFYKYMEQITQYISHCLYCSFLKNLSQIDLEYLVYALNSFLSQLNILNLHSKAFQFWLSIYISDMPIYFYPCIIITNIYI